MLVLGGILVAEVVVGLGDRILMPASACRSNLGASALLVVGIGVLIFALTAAGTFWQRFLGRGIQRHGEHSIQVLRATNPEVAAKVNARVSRFTAGTRLTESMWKHPWLWALLAAAFAAALFGAVILFGTVTQPGTCG
jgi:hypothetical protein